MSEEQIRLKIVKVNVYGSIQYIECSKEEEGTGLDVELFKDLDPCRYWSIKAPSQRILDNRGECVEYRCSSGTFLLSKKLGTVVKPEGFGQGVTVVIRFKDESDKNWYLLVADNKHYLQNVAGGLELGENPMDGAKREVQEELNVNLQHFDLVEIAEWSYSGGNDLVDCTWPCITTAYAAFLPWKAVQHLFVPPRELDPNAVIVTHAKDLPFQLDETEEIFVFAEENVENVPEYFAEYQKTKGTSKVPLEFTKAGHHRQLCELFGTKDPVTVPPFLKTFAFTKRLEEAKKEWDSENHTEI